MSKVQMLDALGNTSGIGERQFVLAIFLERNIPLYSHTIIFREKSI